MPEKGMFGPPEELLGLNPVPETKEKDTPETEKQPDFTVAFKRHTNGKTGISNFSNSDVVGLRKRVELEPGSKIIPDSEKAYDVEVVLDTDPENLLEGKYIVRIIGEANAAEIRAEKPHEKRPLSERDVQQILKRAKGRKVFTEGSVAEIKQVVEIIQGTGHDQLLHDEVENYYSELRSEYNSIYSQTIAAEKVPAAEAYEKLTDSRRDLVEKHIRLYEATNIQPALESMPQFNFYELNYLPELVLFKRITQTPNYFKNNQAQLKEMVARGAGQNEFIVAAIGRDFSPADMKHVYLQTVISRCAEDIEISYSEENDWWSQADFFTISEIQNITSALGLKLEYHQKVVNEAAKGFFRRISISSLVDPDYRSRVHNALETFSTAVGKKPELKGEDFQSCYDDVLFSCLDDINDDAEYEKCLQTFDIFEKLSGTKRSLTQAMIKSFIQDKAIVSLYEYSIGIEDTFQKNITRISNLLQLDLLGADADYLFQVVATMGEYYRGIISLQDSKVALIAATGKSYEFTPKEAAAIYSKAISDTYSSADISQYLTELETYTGVALNYGMVEEAISKKIDAVIHDYRVHKLPQYLSVFRNYFIGQDIRLSEAQELAIVRSTLNNAYSLEFDSKVLSELGIDMRNPNFAPDIQQKYHVYLEKLNYLLGDRFSAEVSNLMRATDVQPVWNEHAVQSMYLKLLLNPRDADNLVMNIEKLQNVVGIAPDFSKVAPEIQNHYRTTIDRILVSGKLDSNEHYLLDRYFSELLKLVDYTRIRPELSEEDTHDLFAKSVALHAGRGAAIEIARLEEALGKKADFKNSPGAIEAYYAELFKKSASYSNTLEESILTMRRVYNATGVRPRIAEDIVQGKYLEIISHLGSEDFNSPEVLVAHLQKITGIMPDYPAMQALINQACGEYFAKTDYDVHDWESKMNKLQSVEQLTGMKLVFLGEIVAEKYVWILSNLDFNKHKKFFSELEALTGVAPDFEKMPLAMSSIYESTIAGVLFNFSGDSEKLRHLVQFIGPIPKDCEPSLQNIYVKMLFSENRITLSKERIKSLEEISGIPFNKESSRENILDMFRVKIMSLQKDTFSETLDTIRKQAAAVDFPLQELPFYSVFNRAIYMISIAQDTRTARKYVRELEQLVGKNFDFPQYAQEILAEYEKSISLMPGLLGLETLTRVHQVTGIQMELNDSVIAQVYRRILSDRDENCSANLALLEKISGKPLSKEAIEEFISELPAFSSAEDLRFVRDVCVRLNMSSEDLARIWGQGTLLYAERYLRDKAAEVAKLTRTILELSKEDDFFHGMRDKLQKIPILATVSKILKLQDTSENAASDPWKNEFGPLITTLFETGVISQKNEKDLQLLVDFVGHIGMVNLPEYFSIFAACSRAETMDDLSEKTISSLETFGIETKRKNGEWKYLTPKELLNEVQLRIKGMRSDLLSSRIPQGLETRIGKEVFLNMRGSTTWERQDSISDLLSVWNRTTTDHPVLGVVAPGFREALLRMPKKNRSASTEKLSDVDIETQTRELLESQEVKDQYSVLAEAFHIALQADSNSEFWEMKQQEIITDLQMDLTGLGELLARTPDELRTMVDQEENPKSKEMLRKKAKGLIDPKARIGFEKQFATLEKNLELVKSFGVAGNKIEQEQELVAVLEQLNRIGGVAGSTDVLRQLSARHMLSIMPTGWQESLHEALMNDFDADPNRIQFMSRVAKEYIEDHYLHFLQNQEHTDHTKFSPALWERLVSVWQQQLDKFGKFGLTNLAEKLQRITEQSDQEKAIVKMSMVPVSGLLHIYAGDIGDGCHSSQHSPIARGKFPNLKTWIYVSNRNTPQETLRGSLLGIETSLVKDGTPVLVARANNPKENFIQSIDADTFVTASLKEVIATAKRIRAERIANTVSIPPSACRQCVAIPLDQRGASCTNRQPVADVYKQRFGSVEKVALVVNDSTSYNGYEIWDRNGFSASGKIWEIDENGKETWYGNWN